jgi:hypothetical protein
MCSKTLQYIIILVIDGCYPVYLYQNGMSHLEIKRPRANTDPSSQDSQLRPKFERSTVAIKDNSLDIRTFPTVTTESYKIT